VKGDERRSDGMRVINADIGYFFSVEKL